MYFYIHSGSCAPVTPDLPSLVTLFNSLLTLLNGRAWQKWLWPLQAVVILAYSSSIAIWLPEFAIHPFGMLIKNLPLLAILWLLWREAGTGEAHV